MDNPTAIAFTVTDPRNHGLVAGRSYALGYSPQPVRLMPKLNPAGWSKGLKGSSKIMRAMADGMWLIPQGAILRVIRTKPFPYASPGAPAWINVKVTCQGITAHGWINPVCLANTSLADVTDTL